MKFLNNIFNIEKDPLLNLHPDFSRKENGWIWNNVHLANFGEDTPDVKIRFGFDDSELLSGINFQTKIGMNLDPNISHKYIGFSYAPKKELDSLKDFAKKFPWAELLENLNTDGLSTKESIRTRLV